MLDIDSLRASFIDELVASGAVSDPAWLNAFRDVHRDAFVPYFFVPDVDKPGWLLAERPGEEWLRGVHSTQALITQIDGDDANHARARDRCRVEGRATSSSSAPTLMALMLNALHVQDAHRVLEVGTGTGYNTALLCHRLGASNVTSIDIDAGLVTRARKTLAALGYRPYLAPIDGIQGCAEQAPFERIIATVAVDRVPEAWLDQATLGATILCPLDLMGRAGLLVSLTIGPNKTAEGWLLPDIGAFMGVRANHHDTLAVMSDIDDNDGDQRKTSLPVDQTVRTNSPFEFFGALLTGGYDWLGFTPSNGGPVENWLTQPNGAWVCHTTDASGNMIVRQGGPIRLWDRIEHAYQQWQELGEPVRERFGLTVRDGQHTIWLDSPGGANQWELDTYLKRGV